MIAGKHFTGIVIALLVAAAGALTAQAEPLRIGHLTWVGLGPLYVAKDKGLFAKEEVEVELIDMAIHEAMYAGLFAGQIDMIDATVDDMLPNFDPEQPYACVFTLTESLGADGIIARTDIRSIADLEGKVVAFAERTGLTVLSQRAAQGGRAQRGGHRNGEHERRRRRQRVPAAGGGRRGQLGAVAHPGEGGGARASARRLVGEAGPDRRLPGDQNRGLRPPPAGVQGARARLGCGARLCRGSPRRGERNHGPARRRLAGGPGGFAETLKGVRFYDSARNGEYFGTPDRPGQIYQTAQYGIDIWQSLGALGVALTPADVIRHDLWVE
jgi:NitT/TauT family transport system substrate-binding protein